MRALLCALAVALVLPLAGCSGCDSQPPGTTCGATGFTCTANDQCCSNFCDTNARACSFPSPICKQQAETCEKAGDCCSMTCLSGRCGAICKPLDTSCSSGAECCTSICTNGKCAPIPNPTGATCSTDGEKCTSSDGCCSKNCQGGYCAPTGGGCQALNNICYRSTDCCSGVCTLAAGQNVGVCTPIPNQTGSGNCTKDGEPCAECGGCCTRTCLPTATGGHACVAASGCHVIGDLCTKDSDCCGAAGSGVAGDGNTTCEIDATTGVGTCRNPMGCNPVGNVCGIKTTSYACGDNSNAREDCCGCDSPKWQCCKVDQAGIPRCFGGGSTTCPNGYDGTANCCIAVGERCLFSGQCCNETPCVPDNMGVLRCGSTCVASGGICTATSDCCTGFSCIVPAGATQGVCGLIPPPPTDAGPPPTDGGLCANLGQHCTTSAECCSPLSCYNNMNQLCPMGDTTCTCFQVIP